MSCATFACSKSCPSWTHPSLRLTFGAGECSGFSTRVNEVSQTDGGKNMKELKIVRVVRECLMSVVFVCF